MDTSNKKKYRQIVNLLKNVLSNIFFYLMNLNLYSNVFREGDHKRGRFHNMKKIMKTETLNAEGGFII